MNGNAAAAQAKGLEAHVFSDAEVVVHELAHIKYAMDNLNTPQESDPKEAYREALNEEIRAYQVQNEYRVRNGAQAMSNDFIEANAKVSVASRTQ